MTQEEKIKEAKRLYETANVDQRYVLETLFPELAESEDERIKKELIEYLVKQTKIQNLYEACEDSDENVATSKKKNKEFQTWIAWLEKQGEQKANYTTIVETGNGSINALVTRELSNNGYVEQKPADKVEPKFKNGQWIVWQDKCYKVNYNGCGYELFDQNGLSTSWGYKVIEDNAHLWTIQDAKEGDVLYSPICKLLWLHKDKDVCYAGHNLNYAEGVVIYQPICIPSDTCPATDDQRHLLFNKLKEAGYEWNPDEKVLKIIPNVRKTVENLSHSEDIPFEDNNGEFKDEPVATPELTEFEKYLAEITDEPLQVKLNARVLFGIARRQIASEIEGEVNDMVAERAEHCGNPMTLYYEGSVKNYRKGIKDTIELIRKGAE